MIPEIAGTVPSSFRKDFLPIYYRLMIPEIAGTVPLCV